MPKSKNNRKRKNKVYHSVQQKNPFSRPMSNTYLRHMEVVGRKLLHLAGVDATFLDRMTKQQLQALLSVPCDRPRVIINKGEYVPQAYLHYVRSALNAMLEQYYVKGDVETGLTLADMLSYGIAFLGGLYLYPHQKRIVLGQVSTVKAVYDAIDKSNLYQDVQHQVVELISYPLMAISQVQFRLYGCHSGLETHLAGTMGMTIALTSVVPESVSFKHFDKRRKAYRFCLGPIEIPDVLPASIKYSAVVPTCSEEEDRELAIYIQQHAILRLKERLHILPPTERTMLLYSTLMLSPKIVRGSDDQPLFVAHINEGEVYGYFSFVTQDDKLFVITFLPVTSALTPEGKRLQKILHLSTQDITYLGMDQLNFLFDIDFDQIPLLKDALVKAGIYQIKAELRKWLPYPDMTNDKQTAFVKKYFEEHPANNSDMPELPDDEDNGNENNEPADVQIEE
jgi:hypothetical protein